MSQRASALAAICLLMSSCLGPQTSDDLPVVSTTYPAVEDIPALESVPALEYQLLTHQGFEPGLIPLRMGFVDGEPSPYWDFGPGTTLLAPVYLLVTDIAQDGSSFTPLPDHPVLFGVIPGQFGYTPLWQVVLVPITSAYSLERITSVGALQAARDEGLVGDFVDLPIAVDCPIVHRDTRLEDRDGERTPKTAYWEGYKIGYYDLGFAIVDVEKSTGTEDAFYALRREGGEPLDESVRGVDMNGDGDLLDSNHVFTSRPGDPTYTPMVRATEVVVTGETISVDTPEEEPDVQGLSDLFDDEGLPRPERVVALYPTSSLRYLPRAPPVADAPPEATADDEESSDGGDATGSDDTDATEADSADATSSSDVDTTEAPIDAAETGSAPSTDVEPGPEPEGDTE